MLVKCRDGVHWVIPQSAPMEKHCSNPQRKHPQQHCEPGESSTLLTFCRLTSVLLGRLQSTTTPSRAGSTSGAVWGCSEPCRLPSVILWQLQPKVTQIEGGISSVWQVVVSAQETKVLNSQGNVGKCFPNSCTSYCKLLGDQPGS